MGVGCVEVSAVGCEGEDGEGGEDYCCGADWAAGRGGFSLGRG